PDTRIRLFDHLFAEVDADQVVLKDVVIEHVFGSLPEIDNPFSKWGRLRAEGHILRVHGAGGVIVAANPADAARNEMRVAGIFVFHEHAVAAENRGRAVTFGHLFVLEIDFREDAEAADDASDRIPAHFDEAFRLR